MRIRIRIFNGMQICDHCYTEPLRLHFEPLRLIVSVHSPPWLNFFGAYKAPKLCLHADPDQISYSDADPDLASQNNTIPGPQPWKQQISWAL